MAIRKAIQIFPQVPMCCTGRKRSRFITIYSSCVKVSYVVFSNVISFSTIILLLYTVILVYYELLLLLQMEIVFQPEVNSIPLVWCLIPQTGGSLPFSSAVRLA